MKKEILNGTRKTILDRCVEVKRILIASINTAKESTK